MYGLFLRLIYLILLVFMLLSLFISLRDLVRRKNRTMMTISIVGFFITVFLFLFQTSTLPIVMIPLIMMIAVPIFLTDKNRNWDGVDHAYRFVSIGAFLSAMIMTASAVLR